MAVSPINNIFEIECKLETTKDKVEFILEHSFSARDDDNTLIILYWMKFDTLSKERLVKLANNFKKCSDVLNVIGLNLTSTDAIKQARRDIQREKKYIASPDANERRLRKQLANKN